MRGLLVLSAGLAPRHDRGDVERFDCLAYDAVPALRYGLEMDQAESRK